MIKETYLVARRKVTAPHDLVLNIWRPRQKGVDGCPLAPSSGLQDEWDRDRIVWKEFVERYYQELRENKKVAPLIEEISVRAAQQDVWLICTEREYPCHRFLVKEVIERILVARGVLQSPEDYSEAYGLYKNRTKSEIKALRKGKRIEPPARASGPFLPAVITDAQSKDK